MLADFQRTFCPTPEQEKAFEEHWQKIRQKLIDEQNCIYCKHARSEKRYEHGMDAGESFWCTIDGRDEYCGLIDQTQRCLFWEYRGDVDEDI